MAAKISKARFVKNSASPQLARARRMWSGRQHLRLMSLELNTNGRRWSSKVHTRLDRLAEKVSCRRPCAIRSSMRRRRLLACHSAFLTLSSSE